MASSLPSPRLSSPGRCSPGRLKNINSEPLETFKAEELPAEKLPGAATSFLTALLPVILLMAGTIYLNTVHSEGPVQQFVAFMSDAPIVMLISLLVATYTLGIKQGKNMNYLANIYVRGGKRYFDDIADRSRLGRF